VGTQRAETYLRVLAETELRRAVSLPRDTQSDPDGPESAWSCLGRVREVASALSMTGAIEPETAEAVTDDLETALVVRHRLKPGRLATRPGRNASRLAAARPAPRPRPGGWQRFTPFDGPAGGALDTVQAVRVGRRMQVADGDVTADVSLTSLVRTVDKEAFAITARMSAGPPGQLVRLSLSRVVAEDDLGNSYHTAFSGGFGVGGAEGWLTIQPALPAGTRWLELHSGPGTPRLRVDVTAAPTPAEVGTEPAGQPCAGERLLDSIAAYLLISLPGHPHTRVSLDETVAALEATGVLPPGSPGVSRVAELCRQAGLDAAPGLVAALRTGRIPPVELPGPWASVLAHFQGRHQPSGREGLMPLAVALPASDAVRFVLTGLESHAEHATLTAVAFGLVGDRLHRPDPGDWIRWFPWWIQDSTGQWHVAAIGDLTSSERERTTFNLRVVPALAPAVTRLEIRLAGPSARIRACVAAEWLAGG
jgi:hypothetical protein